MYFDANAINERLHLETRIQHIAIGNIFDFFRLYFALQLGKKRR